MRVAFSYKYYTKSLSLIKQLLHYHYTTIILRKKIIFIFKY